jgi:hypothetical protein
MPFGLQPDNRFILVFKMADIIAQNGPKRAIEITRPLDVLYAKVAPFVLVIVPTVADRFEEAFFERRIASSPDRMRWMRLTAALPQRESDFFLEHVGVLMQFFRPLWDKTDGDKE